MHATQHTPERIRTSYYINPLSRCETQRVNPLTGAIINARVKHKSHTRNDERDWETTNENEPSFIERDRALATTNEIARATTRDTSLGTRSSLKAVTSREHPTGTIYIPVRDALITSYLRIILSVKCHILASKLQPLKLLLFFSHSPKKKKKKKSHTTSSNLYRSYYPHRLRELVSPVCRIFFKIPFSVL